MAASQTQATGARPPGDPLSLLTPTLDAGHGSIVDDVIGLLGRFAGS
jgi:hypothetical protein